LHEDTAQCEKTVRQERHKLVCAERVVTAEAEEAGRVVVVEAVEEHNVRGLEEPSFEDEGGTYE
jgi:hypothetical protein